MSDVMPQLGTIEESSEVSGLFVLLNTVGGDVEAGLAIAELIKSMSAYCVNTGVRRRAQHYVPVAGT